MSTENKNTLNCPLQKKKTRIADFFKNAPKIRLDRQKSTYGSEITSIFRIWRQNFGTVRHSGLIGSDPSLAEIGLLGALHFSDPLHTDFVALVCAHAWSHHPETWCVAHRYLVLVTSQNLDHLHKFVHREPQFSLSAGN